ncbi:glycosyl hydrolase family 28-related protein [Pseudokineococcus basanitobsidens]|uniref:Glycosyl hydrolase family 28-related protein n=1 Tax=Pseudokineococcus basanitobsidens TaxID=1926649 RepID=A0ABU8RJU8_9ACTN
MSAATTRPAPGASDPAPPRRRRRALLVGTAAVVLLAVVAVVAWLATRPEEVRPEDFGAVGDGSADDTAAVQEALDALEPGQRLELADGAVYATSDVLVLSVPDVEVTGDAELRATDEERSSFRVEGDDVTISDVTLTTPQTTRRWDALEQQRLLLEGTRGVELRDVTVRGSAAAGVFVAGGSSDFLLDGVVVQGTRADGIHITQGSSDGRLVDVRTQDTGDDGVAVVSYAQDGAPSARIEVDSPVVDGTDARGISVVGGEDVTWTDVDVSGTAAAGIYVATEGDPYFTTDTRGVVVDGGRVTDANTDEGTDHGAVLLFDGSDDSSLADVVVRDVDVRGTRESASRQVGVIGEQPVEGVELDGISLEGGPSDLLSAPAAQDLQVEGWTHDGEPVDPVDGGG